MSAEDLNEETVTLAIKAASRVLMQAVLDLLQNDPHSWSTRPCRTCQPISSILGRPFGCVLYALQRSGQKKLTAREKP